MNKLFRCLTITLITLLQASAWAATTYTYTGSNYAAAAIHNFMPPCGAGNCGAFTTAMSQNGSFTTAAPLPANAVNLDVSGLMTAFSFSDGLTTYAMGDPNLLLYSANVYTDASGAILNGYIIFFRWYTPGTHALGDRLDMMQTGYITGKNGKCNQTPVGSFCGTTDFANPGSYIGNEVTKTGTWAVSGDLLPPATLNPVPTLSEWSLILLALMTSAAGWWMARRHTL